MVVLILTRLGVPTDFSAEMYSLKSWHILYTKRFYVELIFVKKFLLHRSIDCSRKKSALK